MNLGKKSTYQSHLRSWLRRVVGLAALLFVTATSSPAAVTFIGKAVLTGTDTDKSGLDGSLLEDGASKNNALNGIGSGLTYAGGNTFYALEDRGPNKVAYSGGTAVDNTTSYPCRFQQLQITLSPVGSPDGSGHYASYTVNVANSGTSLLKNSAGQQYLGISTAYQFTPNRRLDPETIRSLPDGTVWSSDEYGPYILHFDRQGNQIGSLTLPAGFQIANPSPIGANEISGNTTGRVNNKGMEGLAVTPDGKTLVGMMQSPLIQDGGTTGTNVRIIVYDLTNPNATPKQYLYQLDSTSFAISELLAINNHEFLVDERDSTAGNTGKKLLYKFDLNQASAPTDLTTSAFPGTTASNGMSAYKLTTPPGVTPLAKSLFADISALLVGVPSAGAFTSDTANFRNDLPDKLEGYAWGPDLVDGRHLLLVTNDNDFSLPATTPGGAITGKGFPNYVFAFAVDPSDVPNFQPQTFLSEGIRNIDHIIVIYQENWPFDGLYGSFPGANGLANASNASTTQIDRLTGNAVSTLGSNGFNNVALTGVPTANPPPPLTADSNNSGADPHFSPVPNTLQPYSLSSFIDPTILTGDIYHRYWQEQFQIAGTVTGAGGDTELGNNSGFVTWSDNPGLVMSHFDATNLPEGLLAQQYTMCDNFFHSAFGGSFLNHQFLIAAQAPVYNNMPTSNNGNIAYLDANGAFVMNTSGSASGKYARDGSITPVVGDQLTVTINGVSTPVTVTSANAQAYFGASGITYDKHYVVNTTRSVNLAGNGENGNTPPYAVSLLPSQNDSNPTNANGDSRPYIPTIGDELSTANVSWKWYSGGWTQIVAYSGSNPSPTTNPSYSSVNASLQLQYHHQPFAYYDNYAPFGSALVPAAYVGGFAGAGTSGLTAGQANVTQAQNSAAHIQDETNFFADVSNGTLPAVSFIKPVGVNNEHPGYAALQTGQAHVASIVQAVQANPALWAHTAIIITYDEHGGRWDHVTPPVRDIWGPGERVPCIVISPFAKQSYVDHTQYDTSSILSTIEQRFDLAALNQRDQNAPSMAGIFTSAQITRGSFVLNRRAGTFTQTVTVTNTGSTPITGPIQLALDNLSSGTTLTNATGITAHNAPNGSPYITVTGADLAAGASATVTLQFTVPASGGITYSARTITGTATP